MIKNSQTEKKNYILKTASWLLSVSVNPLTCCKEFLISGVVREALSLIAKNEPLGTLDMGKEIKRLAGIPAAQRK